MGSSDSKKNDEKDEEGWDVILHVYKPKKGGKMIYHSGLEFHGREYFYAGGQDEGIFSQKPKTSNDTWEYYESIDVGVCKMTKVEFRKTIKTLRPKWKGTSYHLTSKNCNHFTDALLKKLCPGKSIPSWVNRAAKIGDKVVNMLIGSDHKAQIKPPIEFEKDKSDRFLLDVVDLDKSGGLNILEGTATVKTIMSQDLSNKDGLATLKSDADQQLLLFIPFTKVARLAAISFAFPNSTSGPKTVKVFKNNLNMDFDDAETNEPLVTLSIPKADVDAELPFGSLSVPVKPVKFSSVSALTLFVEENWGSEQTELYKLEFWGIVPSELTSTS